MTSKGWTKEEILDELSRCKEAWEWDGQVRDGVQLLQREARTMKHILRVLEYVVENTSDKPKPNINASAQAKVIIDLHLQVKDVWPDRDANGLRWEIRNQWPQLADAIDRLCNFTEDQGPEEQD